MEFLEYLPTIFAWGNLQVVIIGVVIGLILGALPGLSPTMSVALLISFTFNMQPITALILLGSVYTATVAGGAVSGILINIPGAPANIATIIDGHPMSKSGRASEALHYCFISSFIGGVIGVIVLIFFTPLLAKVALKFGPSELFWVAILGITIIGSLGSKSILKGLFSGFLGLWISSVGYNPIVGKERFIFTEHLTGGVNIIAALIGLFAIPQVFAMLKDTSSKVDLGNLENRSLLKSLKYCISRVRALSLGSIWGVLVGLIPGAGGQVAGLVAYDQTKKTSPDPSKFGSGEPDGVISSEAANNSMVGPSLVPLLTLSIPGSPTAAVLLGGLLIHGLFPGPDLFVNYPDVVWPFINSLLLAQVLMLVFGLLLSRYSRYVITTPKYFMAAAVIVLAFFGAYSVQNSLSDVLVMFSLGILMTYISRYGFSPAPIVLGIILGPIAENNFLQGKLIAESSEGLLSYFFTGGLNLLLIAIILLSIFYSFYNEYRIAKRKSS